MLPVTLVAFLGLMIFALDHRDMGLRLEIIVTLFLSLTAVQFVLADRTPTSSYVVPTQQLVLTTYIFLMLISIESIIVFHLSNWSERTLVAKVCRQCIGALMRRPTMHAPCLANPAFPRPGASQRRRTARRQHTLERRSVPRAQAAAGGAGPRVQPVYREVQHVPRREDTGKTLDLEIATAAAGDAEMKAGGIAYTQSWGSGSGQGPDDSAADNHSNPGSNASGEPARGGAFLRWFRSCCQRPKEPTSLDQFMSSASSASMSSKPRSRGAACEACAAHKMPRCDASGPPPDTLPPPLRPPPSTHTQPSSAWRRTTTLPSLWRT